jgi:hypothetical protein
LNLSLRYEDNGTLHDDIQLRLENETWTCDSYYFALDRNVQENDESTTKVKAVLRKLLEQWLNVVTDLPDTGTAFLPFDFSDQGTGWVRCQRSGDEMILSLGWSRVEGWSIFPSEIGRHHSELPDFESSTPEFRSSREELLRAIENSMAQTE